jgi:membrane protease YdiL (CAAX protease family)
MADRSYVDETCSACGARLYGDAAFCGQCFAKLDRSAPQAPPVAVLEAPARPQWWDQTGAASTPSVEAPPTGGWPVDRAFRDWEPNDPGSPRLAGLQLPSELPYGQPAPIDQRAVRTAIGVIGLGLAYQIVMFALGRVGTVEPSTTIRLSLYGACAFYVLVGVVVVSQAQHVTFRPAWTEGDSTMAGVVGAATGVAVGAGVLFLSRLAAGHVVVDQRIALIVSERSITRIAAAILIAVVAAPLVEELLFRGLVVESMRVRGAGPAIMTGAVLFSVWHLNPSLFLYYLAMGSLLGRLYWRRGLKSSIAGHAAFNGTITLVAIVLALGAHTITNNGVSVQVPGGWHRVTSTTAVPASLDLVLAGPSGSGMFVGHQAMRAGVDVDLNRVAQLIDGGQVPFPGVELAGRSQVTGYAAGPALRVRVRYRGHAGDVVIVKGAAELWTIVLYTGGSGTAEHDLDSSLSHLRLPEAATGNP